MAGIKITDNLKDAFKVALAVLSPKELNRAIGYGLIKSQPAMWRAMNKVASTNGNSFKPVNFKNTFTTTKPLPKSSGGGMLMNFQGRKIRKKGLSSTWPMGMFKSRKKRVKPKTMFGRPISDEKRKTMKGNTVYSWIKTPDKTLTFRNEGNDYLFYTKKWGTGKKATGFRRKPGANRGPIKGWYYGMAGYLTVGPHFNKMAKDYATQKNGPLDQIKKRFDFVIAKNVVNVLVKAGRKTL